MKSMHLKFFTLVFLGLCSSGVTDTDADTDGEMEDTEGTDLVTEDADEDTEGTDGDTGDAGEDTKDTDGDTEDADGDNEGTDGDTEDANGDTEGTDGDTGDANGDTEGTDGDTGDADGDTEGTDGDTGDANGDTEGTDGDTEDADGDNEGTDGDTEDANGDNGDANGDTEGTGGDTGDANGDTEGTDGDTRDADVSSTGATEKRGKDAEDLENLKRGRGASADELSFQSRRQNSGDSQKIIFPGPRSIDDYARMETTLSEDLTSFTLCVHMRSNLVSSMISLVSYAVPEHSNELLFYGFKGGFTLHIQSKIQMADLPVWDGEWHTICTTWRSSDGAWQLYTDGVLRDSGSGFKVGGRVRRGGTWILGQDQDEVGGGFNAEQAFTGELSEVNLWDRVLSPAEIAADCSYHGNVIDWDTTNIAVFGQTSRAEYHQCARARAPVSELSASTTCSNDYMELSIPEDQLTDIDLNNLHWRPDRNCGATTNGTHYLFRTELYDCGTEVTFGAKYVTFLNTIDIVGTHLNSGVITREGNIWITSKCNYERKEWVDSTFLPIPGGLNFTEEGFGQLEVRLSMFPTRQYQRQYRADQYPIHLRLRQHVYMQLEVQGHGQNLAVRALNCKATMSPSPNDSLQYQLIRDGCASDPTLKTYDVDDPGKERFGFEAFRFIREVRTVYVHCEVLVCDAADAGSRCAQGCVRRGKRAAGEVDMRGRHMIYQGPIVLDDDKEAEHAVRLVDDQETGPARRGAPWAMLAAGCVLAALALVVLGAAIVQKRSRRGEWAYHGLKDGE
ncbi:hypothetical protein Bbelb_354930 [Branchiostoma belcheri]|nr:hypothetical protein Bbelb_354930 [Branchiostoma belcheri]